MESSLIQQPPLLFLIELFTKIPVPVMGGTSDSLAFQAGIASQESLLISLIFFLVFFVWFAGYWVQNEFLPNFHEPGSQKYREPVRGSPAGRRIM